MLANAARERYCLGQGAYGTGENRPLPRKGVTAFARKIIERLVVHVQSNRFSADHDVRSACADTMSLANQVCPLVHFCHTQAAIGIREGQHIFLPAQELHRPVIIRTAVDSDGEVKLIY